MNVAHTLSFLQEKCQLSPQNLLLLGVSGGADSICLLHVLHHAGWNVAVFHLNHSIRPEAGQDAAFVADFCARLGVQAAIQIADVPAEAERNHLSIEEAARVVRYRRLFQHAREIGASAVLTAHHAGDQAETILMHFIRGTGLDGLRGMRPVMHLPEYDQAIPLIRPLLGVSRTEIEAYCREFELDYVVDASNSDPSYFRNWLRTDLIPRIESHNPRFQTNLGQMGEILSGDAELLEDLTRAAYASVLAKHGSGWLLLNRTGWVSHPPALQRRMARLAIAELRPYLRDIDFEMVERVGEFFGQPPATGHIDLGAGCVLDRIGEMICLHDAFVDIPVGEYPQVVGEFICGQTEAAELAGGWQMKLEFDEAVGASCRNAPLFEAWLDQGRLALPLCIRARKAGDRIAPLGMGGHSSKVSDQMINHHIPAAARAKYPLVCDADGEVMWLPGICVSERASVSGETRRCVHLTVVGPDAE